jgi:hypothetical protein
MKYESPITYHSKDMTKVQVFADRQQTDIWTGQKVYAPNRLIQGHNKKNGRDYQEVKMFNCLG